MHATFSYVLVLLLLVCCWQSMARHTHGSIRIPARLSSSSSSSNEDSSSEERKCGTCTDRKKNQDETDIDCGGSKCSKCAARKKCLIDCDCISNTCKNGRCTCEPTKPIPTTTTTTTEATTMTPSPSPTEGANTTTAEETTGITDEESTNTTTEETAAVTEEEVISTTTEETTSATDEESISTTTEETTGATDEESISTITEETTSATDEESTNTTTEETAAVTEEEVSSTITEETTGATAEESISTTTEETTSATDEEAAGTTTEETTDIVDEESFSTTAEETTGVTEEVRISTTTQETTGVTEAETVSTTTEETRVATEEARTSETTEEASSVTEETTSATQMETTSTTTAESTSRTTSEKTTKPIEETTTTTVARITTTTLPTCNPPCENGGTCTAHNRCTCTKDFSGPTCDVQSVGLCFNNNQLETKPILLITFGKGSAQFSNATPAQFNFSTTYKQRTTPTVEDGQFAFINSIYDHNGAWHTAAKDHTEDDGGYMYLVNANFQPGQFYSGRVNNLCLGLRYEFSVYLANLCKVTDRIDPNVRFEVRSVDGKKLLAQIDSGNVPERNRMTWQKYGISFVATERSVNLLMISNARGGRGNDLAIDDIALRVCTHRGAGFCPLN